MSSLSEIHPELQVKHFKYWNEDKTKYFQKIYSSMASLHSYAVITKYNHKQTTQMYIYINAYICLPIRAKYDYNHDVCCWWVACERCLPPTQRDCYVPELPQTLISGQGHDQGHEGHKGHGGIEGQELPRRLQGDQGGVGSLTTIHNNNNNLDLDFIQTLMVKKSLNKTVKFMSIVQWHIYSQFCPMS